MWGLHRYFVTRLDQLKFSLHELKAFNKLFLCQQIDSQFLLKMCAKLTYSNVEFLMWQNLPNQVG